MQEALDNLLDAREEYILSLLEDHQSVPLPNQDISQSTSRSNTNVTLSFSVAVNLSTQSAVQEEPEDLPQLGANTTTKYDHSLSEDEGKNATQPAGLKATIVRQVSFPSR